MLRYTFLLELNVRFGSWVPGVLEDSVSAVNRGLSGGSVRTT